MELGLISAISALLSVFKAGEVVEKNLSDNVDPHLLASRGSMTRLLGEFIVEPTFVVSQSVVDSTAFKDVVNMNLNLFTTLYANTFSVLVNVHGVDPAVAFNALSSTNLDLGRVKAWRGYVSNESDNTKPELKNLMDSEVFHESDAADWANMLFSGIEHSVSNEDGAKWAQRSGKADKEPPLVNKNIDITFSSEGKTVVVPVLIRARIITVSAHELKNFITVESDKHSLVNRWNKYQAGGITGAEFVFCKDLLEEYGENLKSTGDVLKALEERRSAAFLNNSATPIGFGRDYGALIVSKSDKELINTVIRGSLEKEKDKNKLLSRTSSFNITVVDDAWEKVQVYTSNIKGVSVIPFEDVKAKDENSQIADMFKNLTESSKIRL